MGLICFDLDGTLVDPLRAMVHCLDLTCAELGLQASGLTLEAPGPAVGQPSQEDGQGQEEGQRRGEGLGQGGSLEVRPKGSPDIDPGPCQHGGREKTC